MTAPYYFSGITLVDVTQTGVTHANGTNEFERNQQRNWETVLQAIGLRAQPTIIDGPRAIEINLKYVKFGELYEGVHKVWAWNFSVEADGVFCRGDDNLALLEQDFDKVPVITYLSETARFLLPIFYTQGAIRNIYFRDGLMDLDNI
jgi:hypothetical protein